MTRSICAALDDAAARLLAVSDSPQLDAHLLLAHVLDVPRSFLYAHADDVLAARSNSQFDGFVARRMQGEPVAYMLGTQEFWSLELAVTPAVLIPRPETERLVEAALERIPVAARWRVCDLGTGSGAIALAIASERPQCAIVATDQCADALAVARRNAQALGLANVSFSQGGWFAALGAQRFDMLVSNPPYVAVGDPHLQAPAMAYEPRQALIAADNGLACLQQLARGAQHHLAPGGHLLVEHGAAQGACVRAAFTHNGFEGTATLRDLAGLERVTLGQGSARVGTGARLRAESA